MDLFSDFNKQMKFDFGEANILNNQVNSNIASKALPPKKTVEQDILDKLDFNSLKNIIYSHREIMNKSREISSNDDSYRKAVVDWDNNALEVIRQYGTKKVLSVIDKHKPFLCKTVSKNKTYFVSFNVLMITLNFFYFDPQQQKLAFITLLKQEFNFLSCYDEKGVKQDKNAIDLLIENRIYKNIFKFFLEDLSQIKKVDSSNTWLDIFDIITNYNENSSILEDLLAGGSGKNKIILYVILLMGLEDKYINKIPSKILEELFQEILKQYNNKKKQEKKKVVFHMCYLILKSKLNKHKEDIENRLKKFSELGILSKKNIVLFSGYFQCSKEFQKNCLQEYFNSKKVFGIYYKKIFFESGFFNEIINTKSTTLLEDFFNEKKLIFMRKKQIFKFSNQACVFDNLEFGIVNILKREQGILEKIYENYYKDFLFICKNKFNDKQKIYILSRLMVNILSRKKVNLETKVEYVDNIKTIEDSGIIKKSCEKAKDYLKKEGYLNIEIQNLLSQEIEYNKIKTEVKIEETTKKRASVL